MPLIMHTPQSFSKQRAKLLNFISRYGEKRITLSTLESFKLLSNEQLIATGHGKPQAIVVTYSEQGKLLGVGYAIDDGTGHCLVVVHPESRNKGIGYHLLNKLIENLNHFICHIALDNVSSLAMCFNSNLQAVSMFKGPTGKLTLRFERRNTNVTPSIRNTDTLSQ